LGAARRATRGDGDQTPPLVKATEREARSRLRMDYDALLTMILFFAGLGLPAML
jgi:hypothetical protein